jgi:hypothetical protein
MAKRKAQKENAKDLAGETVSPLRDLTGYLPADIEGRSLLEAVCKRPKLAPTDPPALVRLVNNHPGMYSLMIGNVMTGATVKSAALISGVTYRTLLTWCRQGALDLDREKDSYCSRLILDLQRATAHAVATAEKLVAVDNPEAYLSKGPGKQFYADTPFWQREQSSSDYAPPHEDPLQPLVEHSTPSSEHEDTSTLPAIEQAVRVLQSTGISESPAFIDSLREQHLPDSEHADTPAQESPDGSFHAHKSLA